MRRRIGLVSALWRYPVKSLRGEALTTAHIAESGIAGDRIWAVRELKYGGIMSARTWASMLALKARYEDDDGAVTIDFPDDRSVHAEDPAASHMLSAWLGREVRLERRCARRPSPEEMEAIISGKMFPPARDFFDEDVLHIVATGTLGYLRRLRSNADFDPRRFRANIYVDTGEALPGFVEDEWIDGALEIAEQVKIAGMRPALRCAVINHPQAELPHDPAILRTTWESHQAYVGVFAAVMASGAVSVGDTVVLAT
jgi:uncharacterized protein YcbX